MAKGAYIGVNGVARKIKGGYIGVSGYARKIKAAYIGIGGVARPFWGSAGVNYYGTITALGTARSSLAATTVGNFALFGGGIASGSRSSTVDAYNKSLTRRTITALGTARSSLAATTVGNYALFGPDSTTSRGPIIAYDTSLTQTIPDYSSSTPTSAAAATTVGDYALFGGGYKNSQQDIVYAYDTSLTRTTPTALSVARSYLAATTVGNYALFGGGNVGTASGFIPSPIVDAYNTSLTRTTPTILSVGRYELAATTVGNYALFGGGGDAFDSASSYTVAPTVDAYNTSLTRTTPTALSVARSVLAATTVGNFALFGGGASGYGSYGADAYNAVDAYDTSLTRTTPTALSVGRYELAATTVGNYALFGGGGDANGSKSTVDAYTITE